MYMLHIFKYVGKTHVGTNTTTRCYGMDTFLIRLIKMPLLKIYYIPRGVGPRGAQCLEGHRK